MKFKFDPNLDFQRDAIDSITGIFEGQEICKTNFTVAPLKMTDDLLGSIDQNDLGIGNRIRLLKEDILENYDRLSLEDRFTFLCGPEVPCFKACSAAVL